MKAGQKVEPHGSPRWGRALRELEIRMIPAYSPRPADAANAASAPAEPLATGTAAGGDLGLAEANQFLRQNYLAEFNRMFAGPAAEKGTAFCRSGRKIWTRCSRSRPNAR